MLPRPQVSASHAYVLADLDGNVESETNVWRRSQEGQSGDAEAMQQGPAEMSQRGQPANMTAGSSVPRQLWQQGHGQSQSRPPAGGSSSPRQLWQLGQEPGSMPPDAGLADHVAEPWLTGAQHRAPPLAACEFIESDRRRQQCKASLDAGRAGHSAEAWQMRSIAACLPSDLAQCAHSHSCTESLAMLKASRLRQGVKAATAQ